MNYEEEEVDEYIDAQWFRWEYDKIFAKNMKKLSLRISQRFRWEFEKSFIENMTKVKITFPKKFKW